MRRPTSESIKSALAQTLDWTIPQLEAAILVDSDDVRKKKEIQGKSSSAKISEIARDLADVARWIEKAAQKLKQLAGKKSR